VIAGLSPVRSKTQDEAGVCREQDVAEPDLRKLDPSGGAQGTLLDESISPEALTLPRASSPIIDVPTAMTSAPLAPRQLPSTPVLAFAAAAAVAFGFAGLQISRVMDGNDRLGVFSAIEIAAARLASVGTVSWTYD
jgi:hypothetical protein